MTFIVTYIHSQPDFTGQAMELIREYRNASSAQSGNLWVETMQERSRRNRFVVIEAWKDESFAQSHECEAPTTHFRSTLRTIQDSYSNKFESNLWLKNWKRH